MLKSRFFSLTPFKFTVLLLLDMIYFQLHIQQIEYIQFEN